MHTGLECKILECNKDLMEAGGRSRKKGALQGEEIKKFFMC